MAVIVTETIPEIQLGTVLTDGSTSSTYKDLHSFDNTIYRRLSMRSSMSVLTYPTQANNEFDLFVQKAVAHELGEVDAGFINANNYLGSLGV